MPVHGPFSKEGSNKTPSKNTGTSSLSTKQKSRQTARTRTRILHSCRRTVQPYWTKITNWYSATPDQVFPEPARKRQKTNEKRLRKAAVKPIIDRRHPACRFLENEFVEKKKAALRSYSASVTFSSLSPSRCVKQFLGFPTQYQSCYSCVERRAQCTALLFFFFFTVLIHLEDATYETSVSPH